MLKFLQYTLQDLTASNHPERYLCNTIYYFYEGVGHYIYLSALTTKNGNIISASSTNNSALIAERECSEMFGIVFETHPDLRKLLLDYSFTGNPLLKHFPLTGYTQIAYTVKKGLLFQGISLPQALRIFNYQHPWPKH